MGARMIAVAGCRRAHDAAPDDLYPDADGPHLQDALGALGVPSMMVSWDDPSIAWGHFSHVVISSTWDSVDRPGDYLAWARHVAEITTLVNSFELIEWNLDKVHQRDLQAAGVPTVPTTWVAAGDVWAPPVRSEFVVKPSISAGGRGTVRYAAADHAAVDHVEALHRQGQTVMVQPYLDAIDTEGEVNIVFFNGAFSHAVKKRPALQIGHGPGERPWERMVWAGVVTPSATEMDVANAAIAATYQRCGIYPTYGRVDLVEDSTGAPTVLELELIDPYLSLDLVPVAAAHMAEAILGTPETRSR
ncbi:MAG: ATP-grasp domain-containing protein [Acidimicrobiales bacterium]